MTMDPYNRRKAAGGRTITVRLNADDVRMLEAMLARHKRSAEALLRDGMWRWADQAGVR